MEMTRTRKWENIRFGYRCFRNTVDQLWLKNSCLDTVGICPNQFVFDDIIRDRDSASDPPELPYPPMPENYDVDNYYSDGDRDFPYYRDVDEEPGERAGGELLPATVM